MATKIRAKNFAFDEISMLVDYVHENKSQLFVSLSSSLSYDDKNRVWEDIAKSRKRMEPSGTRKMFLRNGQMF